MTAFKIEKGVPMPPRRSNNIYPWQSMEIGDSLMIPGEGAASQKNAKLVAMAAYSYGKRTGKKFSFRPVEGGHSIWRVS